MQTYRVHAKNLPYKQSFKCYGKIVLLWDPDKLFVENTPTVVTLQYYPTLFR